MKQFGTSTMLLEACFPAEVCVCLRTKKKQKKRNEMINYQQGKNRLSISQFLMQVWDGHEDQQCHLGCNLWLPLEIYVEV
jgi:hypothetical protein